MWHVVAKLALCVLGVHCGCSGLVVALVLALSVPGWSTVGASGLGPRFFGTVCAWVERCGCSGLVVALVFGTECAWEHVCFLCGGTVCAVFALRVRGLVVARVAGISCAWVSFGFFRRVALRVPPLYVGFALRGPFFGYPSFGLGSLISALVIRL